MASEAAVPVVLGIDVGTSGVRVVAVDRAGAEVASGQVAMREAGDDPRAPETWWTALTGALSLALESIDAHRVRALAIDGTSGTVLACDDSGRPAGPVMMYNDAVDDTGILDCIRNAAPAESAVHGATSGLAKAIVLQERPGVRHILHQADWLAGRFTGRYDLTDENNALKTGYDPVARVWPDWLSATGVRGDLLPSAFEPGTAFAHISPEAARATGLGESVRVVAGTTDGCASFLATGADRPGDGVSALGTTLTVKMLSEKPIFAPQYGIYSHRLGGRWLAGGASNSGGAALARFFDGERIAALSRAIDPKTRTGLDYYPLVKPGERFPIADSDLQPRITPRPDDDAEFLKALLEGIAGIESLAYRRLGELGAPRLRSIRSVGGGARNAAWGAIRESMTGVPFLPVHSQEAAMGAALLALKGARAAGLIAP